MRTGRFQEERRGQMMALLEQRERMAVDDLARHFKVTGATVRSDLTALMRQNKVIRTLGSAMIVRHHPVSPLAERLKLQAAEKRAIGRTAASLISDNEVIALDASSTSLAMAPFLKARSGLTLVTNCLAVAGEFVGCKNVRVIMPGGHLQHDSASLVGREALGFLKTLRIQTAFIGARSLSLELGLCDTDPATIEFKQALMRVSKRVIALADSSKWEAVSLTSFARFDRIQLLVTDAGIAPKNARALARRGVKVLIA
jgi:DeoR/GlpR family transcriptional regulator of sugar metabolism